MVVSLNEQICLALMPGEIEVWEEYAINVGNMACDGMAKAVKYSRNALYVGVVLAIVSVAGAVLTAEATRYVCAVIASLSAVFAIVAAKRLYDSTVFLVQMINQAIPPRHRSVA